MDSNHPKHRRKTNQAQDAGQDQSTGDHVPDPAPAATPGQLAHGVSEFTQLALYMAASLAGMVTALLVARAPFFESMLRRVGGGANRSGRKGGPPRKRRRSRAVPPTPEESLPLLAEAIVGNTKAAVASVFGPPRSAALRGVVKADAAKGNGYWHATTWYYPLPRSGALAMAIEFDDESARRVEFFHAPAA